MSYDLIIVISDTHFPYSHRDTFPFLKKLIQDTGFNPLNKKHRCIHIGDETTGHGWSYHEKNPSLPNSDKELELALKDMKELYKLFPQCDVIESNHGSLAERKRKSAGIPKHWLKTYKDAYEAPDAWQWHRNLRIELDKGAPFNFFHGLGSNAWAEALKLGESLVQGHHHTKLYAHAEYLQSHKAVIQALQVGCLVDDSNPDFDYNKNSALRPKLGCGIIVRGWARAVPLLLTRQGRWVGRLF